MQQCRHYTVGAKVQFNQSRTCHADRMSDIRYSTLPELRCMSLCCQLIGSLDPIKVFSGQKLCGSFHQFRMHLIDHTFTFFWSTFAFHIITSLPFTVCFAKRCHQQALYWIYSLFFQFLQPRSSALTLSSLASGSPPAEPLRHFACC